MFHVSSASYIEIRSTVTFKYIHPFGMLQFLKALNVKQRIKNRLRNTKIVLKDWSKDVRNFLIEIDDYSQAIDGFKNIIDQRRHIFERYVISDFN